MNGMAWHDSKCLFLCAVALHYAWLSNFSLTRATRSSASPVFFPRRKQELATLMVLSRVFMPWVICRSDFGTPRIWRFLLGIDCLFTSYLPILPGHEERESYRPRLHEQTFSSHMFLKSQRRSMVDTYLTQYLDDRLIRLPVLRRGGDAQLDGLVGDGGDALAHLAGAGPDVAAQLQDLGGGRRPFGGLLDQGDGVASCHDFICSGAVDSMYVTVVCGITSSAGDRFWNGAWAMRISSRRCYLTDQPAQYVEFITVPRYYFSKVQVPASSLREFVIR